MSAAPFILSNRFAARAVVGAAALLIAAATSAAKSAPAAPASTQSSAVELASQSQQIEFAKLPADVASFTPQENAFLDDLERRGIQFFIDEADPTTGLMPDRGKANGGAGDVASTASVGFGLTALCVADQRGWISHQEAYDRSLKVLTFIRDHVPGSHGHFYHFLDMHTGQRVWNCEVSNIDTALLMAGVLTTRQHFPDTELARLANDLYEHVDWPWLAAPDGTLCMGWKPDSSKSDGSKSDGAKPDGGFIKATWGQFSEGPLIYLLAMGSRTHPLPASAWRAWQRKPVITYAGLTFIQCPPLFTHQYPQVWFDLRGKRDDYADYFRNAQLATIAQRQWCIDELSKGFPTYGPNLWGLTASDSEHGYTAWGGPPQQGEPDGTVVPCAAAGSLAFEPRLCLDALESLKQRFGDTAYLKYGFVDAFNPSGWYNPDVIGIDIGPGVLMAENARTGFVWKTFMSCPEAQAALKAAGFRPVQSQEQLLLATTSLFKQGNH